MGRLENKVAIVTGAGSGLGRDGAQLFAREGARVVVADVVEETAQQTARVITDAGNAAVAVTADVTKSSDMQRMVERAIGEFGKVDILWANAGVLQRAPYTYAYAEDLPEEEWDRVIAINLTGVFLSCKYVIPHLKKQRSGAIIVTASVSGLQGHATGMASYVASKGAVVNLTRVLATELGPFNIRVNAIAPDAIDTPLIKGLSAPPPGMRWKEERPPPTDVTRRATPLEIARTVVHLAADDIGPLTGAIVSIDGGQAAR